MTPAIPDAGECLATLTARECRVVIVATGGGSAAIPALLSIPGASAAIDEALVPYARGAVDALLGGAQESYCGSRASRRLAMAALDRGRRWGGASARAVGAACTASLATTRAKRGEHRVAVAVQTLPLTTVATVVLAKGRRTRAEEEHLAATLLLERLAAHVSAGHAPAATDRLLLPGERLVVERREAPAEWQAVLAGTSGKARLGPPPPGREAIFPGSFDPLHDGHRRMAHIAARITRLPVAWELSLRNVDKPALDWLEVGIRAATFADAGAWLTAAPTFVEKVALFPGAPFVVGADTYLRLGDPRYYGGSPDRAREAVERIARDSGGLVVFGRVRDGVFVDPARLAVPEPLRAVSTFVGEGEFRDDVSSTVLRRAGADAAD